MTVRIDPNIKKTKVFLDKYGKPTTEEDFFNSMGNNKRGYTSPEEAELLESESLSNE